MNNFRTIIFTSLSTVLVFSIVFVLIYKMVLLPEMESKIVVASTQNNDKNEEVISKVEQDKTEPKFKPQIETVSSRIQTNRTISNQRTTIITETVKKVSPAVVGINVTEIQQYRLDAFWRRFYGDQIYQKEMKGIGSGIIVSPDGYIITNDHVAGNAVEAKVTLTDGRRFDAKIVGTDQASDVCLLKIDGKDLPYVTIGNSDDVLIGEWAIALGNPFGLFEINDKPTVTVGVISASGMNLGGVNGRYYYNMIQTDAPINGGNSGGPLVNSLGELIGINTLIYTTQTSSGSVGVGFAIPINKVNKVVKTLKKDGKVARDFWTGITIQPIDASIAKYYKLKDVRGVIVSNVANNSPASKAGIKVGDIIRKVDNNNISDQESLISLLKHYMTNDILNLEILHDGEKSIKQLHLEKRKG